MKAFLQLMIVALTGSFAFAASSLLDKIKDDPDLSQVLFLIIFRTTFLRCMYKEPVKSGVDLIFIFFQNSTSKKRLRNRSRATCFQELACIYI